MWKFAPSAFPGNDVVRDFCSRMGIDIREDRIQRVNESLTRPAISILYAYRRFGQGHGVGTGAMRENHALVEAARTVEGAKLRFANSAVEPVLEANADDLAWIEERLGEEALLGHLAADEGGVRTEDDLLEIEEGALKAFLDAVQAQNEIAATRRRHRAARHRPAGRRRDGRSLPGRHRREHEAVEVALGRSRTATMRAPMRAGPSSSSNRSSEATSSRAWWIKGS